MDVAGGEYLVWTHANGVKTLAVRGKNQRLVDWGRAAARLFAGDMRYKIGACYIEYANAATAGAVAVPVFSAFSNLNYYRALAGSASDYLRVPVIMPATFEIAAGYESYFAAGDGNQILLSARSQGVAGVNGSAFSSAAGSVVIGFAFVAAPNWADPTADVGFGRAYYPAAQQIPKLANLSVSIDYRPFFGLA